MHRREMDCDCPESLHNPSHMKVWEVKNDINEEGWYNTHYEIICVFCKEATVIP